MICILWLEVILILTIWSYFAVHVCWWYWTGSVSLICKYVWLCGPWHVHILRGTLLLKINATVKHKISFRFFFFSWLTAFLCPQIQTFLFYITFLNFLYCTSLVCLSLCTSGFLVFFSQPWRNKNSTSKINWTCIKY